MPNPSQLFLLADHIKLSLLERQRAISLNLEPTSQDGHISRSLESLREGLEAIEADRERQEHNADSNDAALEDQETRLRAQYDELTSQFRGFSSTTNSTLKQPNDRALFSEFYASKSRPSVPSSSSFLKRSATGSTNSPKSVRFSDSPSPLKPGDDGESNRAALFPYRDNPDTPPDLSDLDNQQIHQYHSKVIRDQDEQLDRLGESIGRQRELSIQIGDELDSHVQMLDEVDEHVDRHQTRLDGARKRLGTVARKAKDNKQLTVILILIIVLVLLIIILK